MADKNIGALTEAPIGSLPEIAELYDDSLLAVEQQGEARRMSGAQWKAYARAGAEKYVEGAHEAAAAAAADAARAEREADDAAASAVSARQYAGKPPVIREGTWRIWNAEAQAYQDTGQPARGETGAQIGRAHV